MGPIVGAPGGRVKSRLIFALRRKCLAEYSEYLTPPVAEDDASPRDAQDALRSKAKPARLSRSGARGSALSERV